MTFAASAAVAGLGELYGRHKALALATGAALVLGREIDEIAAQAREPQAHCEAALCTADETRAALVVCEEEAADLVGLLSAAMRDAGAVCVEGRPEGVRASRRRLRREVWRHVPCEYVSCSISRGGHHHTSERRSMADCSILDDTLQVAESSRIVAGGAGAVAR